MIKADRTTLSAQAKDLYLSKVSPKDKSWDDHRSNAELVRNLYALTDLDRYAERIENCSLLLDFALSTTSEGAVGLKLSSVHFCRVRHCPVCQWRRSLMWRARFLQAIPRIFEARPDARFIFLTLTVRNCELSELRSTLSQMNKAWVRLSQRKQFPALGWVKSVEVTRSSTGEAHPHFHALLMVNPSYFKRGYLSQAKWTELWQASLRATYTPVVNVKVVKPRPSAEDTPAAALAAGVLEVLKYGVKEGDLVADREWLAELTRQMHKTRAVAVGGELRQFLSEDEPEDLINVDETNLEEPTEGARHVRFGYNHKRKRYTYKESHEHQEERSPAEQPETEARVKA